MFPSHFPRIWGMEMELVSPVLPSQRVSWDNLAFPLPDSQGHGVQESIPRKVG